jgi:prepilin-type N-terminal cleavage/methylation domain-containing protein
MKKKIEDSPWRTPNAQRSTFNVQRRDAFTLIELLIVISIIIILMGLLFPAFRGAQDQAKKVQAKNDLTQIVTAVNAYYTEYGKYPVLTDDTPITNSTNLFNALRGIDASNAVNPRKIVFVTLPDVKDTAHPRSGIGTDGQFYDPWGTPYKIAIDGDYDNQISNPYSQNAGPAMLRLGIIAWSLGKDKAGGSGDKKSGASDDDVISWQ